MKNYGAVEEGVPPEFTNCFTFSVKIISRFKTRLKHAYPYVNVSSEFLNLHVSHAAECIHFAHLVWNRVWFSRELRERMNIFIVSVLNK